MIKLLRDNRKKILEILLFCFILFIAGIFRFSCINKVDGLWYDELVMFHQAAQNNVKDVLLTVLSEDVHLPLYQILLHYWGKLFTYSDFSLRLFSVVLGLFTVVVSFFAGRELKSNLTGYFFMGLTAVNSFLIYYSQEVRMYELLALFSSLNLLFLIKIYKKGSNIDYLCWIFASIGLILTYTISIIYVGFQILVYGLFSLKNIDKKFIISVLVLLLFNLPVICYLIAARTKFLTFTTGFYSDYSSLFVVVQNFFTPVLTGIGTNPPHYISLLLNNFNFLSFIEIIIPIVIAFYLIFCSIKNSKFSKMIAVITFLFLLFEILLFIFGNFKILSRYLIILLPGMLLLAAVAAEQKAKILNIVLISILIGINFLYLFFSPNASFRATRTGFLPLVKLLEESEINDGDIVVVWNRKEVLSKYLNKKVLVLSILKDFAYRSETIFELSDELNSSDERGKKTLLRKYFASNQVPYNTNLLLNFIFAGMQKDQKIIITAHEYFDEFNEEVFHNLILDDNKFENITYNNLLTIKSLLDLEYTCDKNLEYVATKKKSSFVAYIYKK